MENNCKKITPHPQFLDILFSFKGSVSRVFKDVIGIHQIHHFSLARINQHQELVALSSTPAIEFNLFNGPLWQYDRTYNPHWFNLCTQSTWQALYQPSRYDELYYLKQSKLSYPIGISLAHKIGQNFMIYSLASNKSCTRTHDLFANRGEDFYEIGQHCANELMPVFNYCDQLNSMGLAMSA